jgi:hypothetical protein
MGCKFFMHVVKILELLCILKDMNFRKFISITRYNYKLQFLLLLYVQILIGKIMLDENHQ